MIGKLAAAAEAGYADGRALRPPRTEAYLSHRLRAAYLAAHRRGQMLLAPQQPPGTGGPSNGRA